MIKMKLTNRPTVYICFLGIFLLLFTFNRRPIVVEKTEPVIAWQDKALGDAVKYNMWRSEEDEVSISRAEKFDSGISSDSTGSPASSLSRMVLDNCPIETLPKSPGSLDILELRRTSVKDLSILPPEIRVIEIKNNDIDFQSLDGFKNLSILKICNADLGNIDEIICLPTFVFQRGEFYEKMETYD